MSDETEQQKVLIKGTKEGLVFYLDDSCTFQELIRSIQKMLKKGNIHWNDKEKATVTLKLGYRYLHKEQKELLKQVIEKEQQLVIDTFDGEVIDKRKAKEWLDHQKVKRFTQIVRSGQVLEVNGDLLLIGDVNPGGQVKASGSIYVLGNLYGIAHAGIKGDEQAVIAASYMQPTQLRIANYISRAPDYDTDGLYMECGYLSKHDEKITIDKLQNFPHKQKEISEIERGMMDG